jgi:hypothetical protein
MSKQIRFLADEDLNTLIVESLLQRQPLIDFQTVPAAGLKGTPDPALLAFAAEQGRILVSHDFSTMPTHFANFLESGQHSPGLFLIHQELPIAQAIAELLLIWEASTAEEWYDQVRYLPL